MKRTTEEWSNSVTCRAFCEYLFLCEHLLGYSWWDMGRNCKAALKTLLRAMIVTKEFKIGSKWVRIANEDMCNRTNPPSGPA